MTADLDYDSLIDAEDEATRRSAARHLTFAHERSRVEVDATTCSGWVYVTLVLVPARPAAFEVRTHDTGFTVTSGSGRAEFDLPSGTLLSVVISVSAPREPRIQTAWVRL